MVEVEGQEVHAAWHASVAAQCASRGVSAPPPPPEEAAWFQSGHSRRTEGMREPQPADEARAGPGEGTVLEAVRLPPPSAKPRPAPAQRAAQPVARASPAASPDQRRLLLGVPLAHWLGPCLAALVGVLSMLAISRTNGPQIPTLPATRYFAPSSRVAGYAAKLYSEIKGTTTSPHSRCTPWRLTRAQTCRCCVLTATWTRCEALCIAVLLFADDTPLGDLCGHFVPVFRPLFAVHHP